MDCPEKLPPIPEFDKIKNLPVETVPYSEGKKKKFILYRIKLNISRRKNIF